MSIIRSDHKALVFLGAVGALGAGVRVVRASSTFSHDRQPALERQMQAADSSAKVVHAPKSKASKTTTPAKTVGRRAGAAPDSARRTYGSGPLDRPGYVNGKLDLDVATAAQIDSLPGVSTLMAKRIVADRMRRGPFVTREALRRVSGAGPLFIARLDSLVIFSGTVVQPNAADTVIVRRPPSRARAAKRP
jgi:DNA uptake protein ComE-like DNA-binding protein